MSIWFVTGASRGFGLELVRAARAGGHRVVATARRTRALDEVLADADDNVLTLPLDVTDQDSARRAVRAAVDAFGRIDVLVNNAGRGLLSAVEEADGEAVRALFDVNVFGTLNVTRAVLPVMRAQNSGHILTISSVGGLQASAGWGIYASTKFAVEGAFEALRAEVEPLGIKVTLVEPGYFRTDFLDGSSLETEARVIDDYDGTVGATRRREADHNHEQRGDPAKAAAAIVRVTEADHPPLHLLLGPDAVARTEQKFLTFQKDIEAWRALSVSTDLEDAVN
jgi:NAD(P)-dependent dehydrogenase (short-subunit alcohol dehydrogenase family)